MSNAFRVTGGLLMGTVLLALRLAAQDRGPNAEAVKVAMVVQLVQFVSWPPAALPSANRPLELCVLKNDDWFPLQAVHGESVNGRPIKVTRIDKAPEALPCHILVIGATVEVSWLDVLEKLPILTIRGEKTGQSRRAMVTLSTEGGRTRFSLDVERADRAHLRFSSKLLHLADVALRDLP